MREAMFEQQLRQAVQASAAPVNPDFLSQMEQMIDHLPRKERPVMKRKLSLGLVLALVLCMLTLGALAVALLTNEELVEQEVLPLALKNDISGLNEVLSHEDLVRVLALAEENGIDLTKNPHIHRAYEAGEGYWEGEVIMAIAKDAFGPYPGQWTLEQQCWFEEMMVRIGFKEYNAIRIPGEGELSYEAAYALAKEYIAENCGAQAAAHLDDREEYSLWRRYSADLDADGTILPPMWYFDFEANSPDLGTYHVDMDAAGKLMAFSHEPPLGEIDPLTVLDVRQRFEQLYGWEPDWAQETWVRYGQWLRRTTDPDTWPLSAVTYIPVPTGALSKEQASQAAIAAVQGTDSRVTSAVCMLHGEQPVWKVLVRDVTVPSADGLSLFVVEVDAFTGETQSVSERGTNLLSPYMPQ